MHGFGAAVSRLKQCSCRCFGSVDAVDLPTFEAHIIGSSSKTSGTLKPQASVEELAFRAFRAYLSVSGSKLGFQYVLRTART